MTTRMLARGAAMADSTASVSRLISGAQLFGCATLDEGDLNQRHRCLRPARSNRDG